MLSLVASLGVVGCLWLLSRTSPKTTFSYFIVTLTVTLGALYVVARAYIVVEVFLAFRSMPLELYEIQSWTR